MIFQTWFLLLGLQLTKAVLLSQEEDAKIKAAYPNLKTRPRIARRLREGKHDLFKGVYPYILLVHGSYTFC